MVLCVPNSIMVIHMDPLGSYRVEGSGLGFSDIRFFEYWDPKP